MRTVFVKHGAGRMQSCGKKHQLSVFFSSSGVKALEGEVKSGQEEG